MPKNHLQYLLLRVIMPLFLGAWIYILFGAGNIRLVRWAEGIPPLKKMRETFEGTDVPDWLVFNLPGGLWIFALLQMVYFVWGNRKKAENWIVLCIILAIGHEIGQYMAWFSGTYDDMDVITYLIFIILSVLLYRKYPVMEE